MPLIKTCKDCGVNDYLHGQGLCSRCYYQTHKETIRRRNKMAAMVRHHEKLRLHHKRCEALRDRLLREMRSDAHECWADWHEAARIYNRNITSPLHYRALIKAVQSVGGEYGLTSIPTEQGGGVTCRRTI